MKKTLSVIVLLIASAGAMFAQTKQGTLFFGGSIGITSSKDEDSGEDDKSTTFEFSPGAGFFIVDNFAVGLDLQMSGTKVDDGLGGDDKYRSIGINPYARYYIFTPNEKFAFMAEGGFVVGGTRYEPDGQDERKGGYITAYISPGFTFFPTERWGIDLQFSGFSFTSSDPNKDVDDDKSTSFHLGLTSFSPSLGVRYYLSK